MNFFTKNFFKQHSNEIETNKNLVVYFNNQKDWKNNLLKSFKFNTESEKITETEKQLNLIRHLLKNKVIDENLLDNFNFNEDGSEHLLILKLSIDFYTGKNKKINTNNNKIFNFVENNLFKKHLCKILLLKENFNSFKELTIMFNNDGKEEEICVLDEKCIMEHILDWNKRQDKKLLDKIKKILKTTKIETDYIFIELYNNNLIEFIETDNLIDFLKSTSNENINIKINNNYVDMNINILIIQLFKKSIFDLSYILKVYNYAISQGKKIPQSWFYYFQHILLKNLLIDPLKESVMFIGWRDLLKTNNKKIDLFESNFYILSPFNKFEELTLDEINFIKKHYNMFIFNEQNKTLFLEKYLKDNMMNILNNNKEIHKDFYDETVFFLENDFFPFFQSLNVDILKYHNSSQVDLKNISLSMNQHGKYISHSFNINKIKTILTTNTYENVIVGKFLQESSLYDFFEHFKTELTINNLNEKINDFYSSFSVLTANLADQAFNADVYKNDYLLEFKRNIDEFDTEISSKHLIFSINLYHKFLKPILLHFYFVNKISSKTNILYLNKICAKFNKFLLTNNSNISLIDLYNNPYYDQYEIDIQKIITSGRHYIITAKYENNNDRYIYHDYFQYFLCDCDSAIENVKFFKSENSHNLDITLKNKINNDIDLYQYLSDISKLNFFFNLDKNTIIGGTPNMNKPLIDFFEKIFEEDGIQREQEIMKLKEELKSQQYQR